VQQGWDEENGQEGKCRFDHARMIKKQAPINKSLIRHVSP
jgi:hypothetical protein